MHGNGKYKNNSRLQSDLLSIYDEVEVAATLDLTTI